MIDENLMRAELSPADRAQQTARRKAIYLELHPETAHGKASPNKEENFSSFDKDTAAKTGQTDRTVRLHAERGEKVIDEVLHPETAPGAVGRAGYQEKDGQVVHSFADATAAVTGTTSTQREERTTCPLQTSLTPRLPSPAPMPGPSAAMPSADRRSASAPR